MGTHVSFIFRGYNPYIRGLKPHFSWFWGPKVVAVEIHGKKESWAKGTWGFYVLSKVQEMNTPKLRWDCHRFCLALSYKKKSWGDGEAIHGRDVGSTSHLWGPCIVQLPKALGMDLWKVQTSGQNIHLGGWFVATLIYHWEPKG